MLDLSSLFWPIPMSLLCRLYQQRHEKQSGLEGPLGTETLRTRGSTPWLVSSGPSRPGSACRALAEPRAAAGQGPITDRPLNQSNVSSLRTTSSRWSYFRRILDRVYVQVPHRTIPKTWPCFICGVTAHLHYIYITFTFRSRLYPKRLLLYYSKYISQKKEKQSSIAVRSVRENSSSLSGA